MTDTTTQPQKPQPSQTEIASGTPPACTPQTLPDTTDNTDNTDNTDVQPEQNPIRGTPDASTPKADV